MPRAAGKMGFSCFQSWNGHTKLKSVFSNNGQNLFLRPRPSSVLRFWVAHLHGSSKEKKVFENRPNFAETAENVVPKWRGRKRNFGTGGSEIGHLRSGSEVVPKYVSFRCTSFPIHLQEDKESCLNVLAFSLDNMFLSIIFGESILLCNKYLSFSWFCSILCLCWLCLLFC